MALAMKKCPSNGLLGPGEMWVMLDSGANVDATSIEEHLKDCVPFFIDCNTDSKNAESTCGGVVTNLGKCTVRGTIDGEDASIGFTHMKVKMPIASLPKRVKGKYGCNILITEDGGIKAKHHNGRVTRIYDRGGVFKFKPTAPGKNADLSFGRQGCSVICAKSNP